MVGGASQFLDSPSVNKQPDVHFFQQIAASDGDLIHEAIDDGAGFHHRDSGGELPANLRIITPPAYNLELNPVKKF